MIKFLCSLGPAEKEVMRSLHHSLLSQALPSSKFSHFGSFFSLSQCFFSFLHRLCISGEFCQCLWAFLFLFSSQNPFWDSISVHPSIQLTAIETRKCDQCQRLEAPALALPHVASSEGRYFLFPTMLQESCLLRARIVSLLLLLAGPASKTQIRKDGTF